MSPSRSVRNAPAFEFPAPDLDLTHDPGHEAAARRVEKIQPIPDPIRLGECEVRVGTASWTDPTLLRPGLFYPPGTNSAELRLRHYASRFSFVEVDSSYYAIPSARTAELWVERTPAEFTYNLKAHALMTGQPTDPSRLPRMLRDELPRELLESGRLYPAKLASELLDRIWTLYLEGIEPLRAAGKLGAVILQYPRWFIPSREAVDTMLAARDRLGDIPGAVELRNARWFAPGREKRLVDFLTRERIPFVVVDGPQGLESSVPPVAAVTSSSISVVRLHGRRAAAWEARGYETVERYRYLYDGDELSAWVSRISELASDTKRVYATFNNCHGNYGVAGALQFGSMLRDQLSAKVAD